MQAFTWGGREVRGTYNFLFLEEKECKLSHGVVAKLDIKLPLSGGKRVVAKSQGDKSASPSSRECCDPWISAPFRVSVLLLETHRLPKTR